MNNPVADESRRDPHQRADVALKQVLLGLLDTLEANVEGARTAADSEFLHDLRVATRRTRSVLSQIGGVFPEETLATFREGFAWLQAVTGPARDLDVHVLTFDRDREDLPAAMQPALEPLRTFLIAARKSEQGRLLETLDSARFQGLIRDWRLFLTTPVPTESARADAMRPIKVLTDERIRRLVKRVRREGRALDDASPSTHLHALRKRCKKLRYLIELFRHLYPDDGIQAVLKPLKRLLDQLGAYQDLSVQAAHLRETAERMRETSQASTETLLAIGALIGQRQSRLRETRARVGEVFSLFDEPRQRQVYRRLFWPGEDEDGTAP